MPLLARTTTAIVLIAAVLLSAGPAGAQEPGPVTFGVAPSSASGPDGRDAFTYDLSPGDVVEDYVGISNFGDAPVELAVYASDAFTTPEGGFDLLPANERPIDVGSWVGFTSRAVVVPARSRVDVPFRLEVPPDATPGDHPGGIVASLRTGGGRVSIDRRVGARIYLRVAGEVEPDLDVGGVRVSYHGATNPLGAGRAEVQYTVRNTGNVRLAGTARLRLAGPFGLGARTVVLDELPEILPGDELTRTATVEDLLPVLRLRATVTVEPEAPDRAVGAVAALPDLDAVSSTGTAWAISWSSLLSIALLAGLVLVLNLRRRARERRHQAELDAARRGAGRVAEGAAAATVGTTTAIDPAP